MKFPRRRFLELAGVAAVASALPRPALALDYPTRPVRFVVGFPAGGQQDTMARLICQWLSERLGQQFLVENRSGAGGNVGAEAVINSPPDGYTMLLVGSPNAINATLYQKLNFVFLRDIVPVASFARTPLVIEVHPSVPVHTLPEFVAYAKANPGKVNYASAGIGTLQHVPTATEFIPGYLAESWYGAGVPRNTPTEIVDKLNREVNAGLADARIATRIVELGAYVVTGSPADFRQMVADEIEKWGKVVKASGARAE